MIIPECDLLGIGLSVLDQSLFVDHHPNKDEKTNALSKVESVGGPSCIGTLCANRLGLKTSLISAIGKDLAGSFIRTEQAKFNRHELIEVQANESSQATIIIKPDGCRTVIASPARGLIDKAINFDKNPKLILCDGRLANMYYELIKKMKQLGSQIILDAGSANSGILKLLPLCDFLICSSKFAVQYTRKDSYKEAYISLAEEFSQFAMTVGSEGCYYQSNNTKGHLKAHKIKIKNSNSAGDFFHGAFATAIFREYTFEKALEKANEVAAWHCTNKDSMESLNKIRLQKFF